MVMIVYPRIVYIFHFSRIRKVCGWRRVGKNLSIHDVYDARRVKEKPKLQYFRKLVHINLVSKSHQSLHKNGYDLECASRCEQ